VLFELVAVDANAKAQCPGLPAGQDCKVYFGLENNLSPAGEVIRFQTKTISQGGNVQEVPVGTAKWDLCHNQAFSPVQKFVVDAKVNSSKTNGGATGTPLNTGISFVLGDPLIVSVDPNAPNIWNSGVLAGGANNCGPVGFGCRWSNADGQVRNLVARDDDGPTPAQSSAAISGEPVGTLIGENLFAKGSWNTQGGLTAAIGTLVGRIGTTFFVLGTDFNGLAPDTGTLELFYWDINRDDNEGTVTVQVLEGQPIDCTVDDEPVAVVANVRGEQTVEVEGFPTLNVKDNSSTAVFPFAVLGCNIGDAAIAFGSNGSPIQTNNVLVNNMLVPIKSFSVSNTVSRPSCDSGLALADLNLKLNKKAFIAAIRSKFPGGQCSNGPVDYTVTLHSGGTPQAFFGGQDTVDLTNCK
jgi:hypothetical protein